MQDINEIRRLKSAWGETVEEAILSPSCKWRVLSRSLVFPPRSSSWLVYPWYHYMGCTSRTFIIASTPKYRMYGFRRAYLCSPSNRVVCFEGRNKGRWGVIRSGQGYNERRSRRSCGPFEHAFSPPPAPPGGGHSPATPVFAWEDFYLD